MGYQLRNYSLGELSRISVPGTITPALFWAMPIGRWHGTWSIKDRFMRRKSLSNQYGVLLYHSDEPPTRTDSDVNLATLEARLADVMPSGIEGFLRSSAFREDEQKLLILSAGYPQPGWGVLLNCPGVDAFEEVLATAIQRFANSVHETALTPFDEAKKRFRALRRTERSRPGDSSANGPATLALQIQSRESVLDVVQQALDALHLKAFSVAADRIADAVPLLLPLQLPDKDSLIQEVSRNRKLLEAAERLAGLDDHAFVSRLESAVDDLDAQRRTKREVFSSLVVASGKQALAACLHLRDENVCDTVKECCAWAGRELGGLHRELCDRLEPLAQLLRDELIRLRGEKAQIESERKARLNVWVAQKNKAEAAFRVALEQATVAQWEVGPAFLVGLEKACSDNGLWVRSIPWDPARMVGWKLKAFGVSLQSSDLWAAAREIVPEAPKPAEGEVDGSYFTDYVHYVAISCPQLTPFSVTQQIVATLLRHSELSRIIKAHEGSVDEAADALALAGQVLRCFGWNESASTRETPLEHCLDRTVEGSIRLKAGLTIHDLRTVVESFCKDLVDVAVQVLGYDTDRIWEVIHYENPLYQPRSRDKDWDEEVSRLTIGSAEIILQSLLSLAWPAASVAAAAFFEAFAKLRPPLNAKSHHSSDTSHDTTADSHAPDDRAAELVDRLLEATKALVGEMPWHMTSTIVYGHQPKVLSGEAWSHSSATPRLIRVIDWNGRALGRKVMLWNKTGRNPVIADPEFIRRPISQP
jgi:hypothetical protein